MSKDSGDGCLMVLLMPALVVFWAVVVIAVMLIRSGWNKECFRRGGTIVLAVPPVCLRSEAMIPDSVLVPLAKKPPPPSADVR